jgi:hypothetical protein
MIKKTIALVSVCLAGCVGQPVKRQDMSAFEAAAPRSILVVPVVNKSLDVDAPNYVLSTLPVPIAEKGYYVFPVNTTKYVLEQEGMYEAERIHNESPEALAKLFGADAILYVTINRWDATYAVIAATVTVDFDYKLVSKDGTEIWKEHRAMQYSPGNSSSGSPLAIVLGAIINSALTRAAPNYMPLARGANQQAFVVGPNAIPDGPYQTKKSQ